jgi:thiamine-phosphate pyrophosphorylase
MRGFYAIVDPALCADPVLTAQEILYGGCAALQLRAKTMTCRDQLALARRLLVLCKARGVPFFVNDRVDIARAAGAHGVHLGQTDLPLPDARSCFPGGLIGISTHDRAQASAAMAAGADLIGFGPIFPTRTKDNASPVVGTALLAEVVRSATVPVVAIGGIDASNLAEVASTRVAMVCALSAVLTSSDSRTAARTFHHALSGADY